MGMPKLSIPLCEPEIRGNEWQYVKECLDTNWVSSAGKYVDRFEDLLAEYTGRVHAVATVNGTAALHVALMIAGVQPDDEVLVPSLSFIAPANAVRYTGAWPVFIDADPDFWQMEPNLVARFLDEECESRDDELYNRSTGRRVSAILPVHILGHPVDIAPIMELANKYDLPIIEDAAESLGAYYAGRRVGRFGDIACFSFNGNKLVTSGGGGMLVTDCEDWATLARYISTQARDDETEYIHEHVGFNYRLTNIQAALGCAQMEMIDEYVAAKRRTAETYRSSLADVEGIAPMPEASWAAGTFWLYTIRVDPHAFGMDSRVLMRALAEQGIQSRPLWQPLHLSPAHTGAHAVDGAVAEMLWREALSIPCSVGITDTELDTVISCIKGAQR
jgi:perosamine synthetase